MAVYKGNRLSGAVGPVISYWVNGKNYIRSRNTGIRQSKAMEQTAKAFGRVKNISAGLRLGLKPVFEDYKSKPAMFAVDAAVRGWYNHVYPGLEHTSINSPYLASIPINRQAPTNPEIVLGVRPQVDWNTPGKINVSIPEVKVAGMYVPTQTSALSLTLVVTGTMVGRVGPVLHASGEAVEQMILDGKITGTTMELSLEMPRDYLFLAWLQVCYCTPYGWLNQNHWKPLMAIGSYYKKPVSQ